MKEKNKQKITSGILNSGFDFKGMHFRPITGRTLVLLERAGSPFYFGGSQLQGMMDYLYVSATDIKDVLASINDGSFEEKAMEFADKFTPEDLQNLGKFVAEQQDIVEAATVEVRDTGDSDTKKK